MIGLLLNGLFRRMFFMPCAILAGVATICGLFGCFRCLRCRIRDCYCVKRILRIIGHDQFDDFELMLLVHEAIFERRDAKLTTVVRVTAGSHFVKTDPNSNGIFQQPLHVTVEQGTTTIVIDLLDIHDRLLAQLRLDTMQRVLRPKTMQPETLYAMKQKGKGIRNPKIKLTMVVSMGNEVERGLLSDVVSDVDILVRQQMQKAKEEGKNPGGEDLTDTEVLKQSCAGPLEVFEGLGMTTTVYVGVLGPPTSRRWVLGLWGDKHQYDAKNNPVQAVDLLKVQSIQADPARHHVFVINFFDDNRVRQSLTFRRIDRARDVWVELLHLLVKRAHESKDATRAAKMTGTTSMALAPSGGRMSSKGR